MPNPIEELTDKEKEALQLLLEGHDTKSSASQLGLSVHTINDRLRNARRKLGVSSSREAARILRDAEGEEPNGAPQNDAHTSFGIEPAGDTPDTAILTQTKRAEPFRFTWLAGGMLIMSIFIAVAVLAVVSTSEDAGDTAAASSAAPAASTAATTAASNREDAESYDVAETFLASVDAGDWQQSWRDAGEFFQTQTTAAEWSAAVDPVRSPLGAVEERKLASVQQLTTLPGAPDGEYEVLRFETKYAEVEGLSIETVIMIRNGSSFNVAGYFIR